MPLSLALTGGSFAFMLVLCRCAGAVMLLPGFGEADPPAVVRAGFAFALAVLLTPALAGHLPAPPDSFLRLAGLIAGELMAGVLLGWLARLVAMALPVAGQLLSLATGHTSVLQPDAGLGAEVLAMSRMFNLAVPVLVLATPLYALPLQALADSYAAMPAGGGFAQGVVTHGAAGGATEGMADSLAAGDLAESAVRAAGQCLALAVTLASPFLLLSLVWQTGLGLLSRLVPHLQVYFVAMPGQLLGGLLVLALLANTLLTAWMDAAQAGFAALP